MNTELIQSISGLGAAGVIVGLITVIKPLIKNHAWLPVIAIILGIVLNILIVLSLQSVIGNWGATILIGIMVGLTASGAYSGTAEIIRGGS